MHQPDHSYLVRKIMAAKFSPASLGSPRWHLSVIATFALIPVLALVSGCGEKRVRVVPVTGKVSFQGQSPAGAQVVLHPVSATTVPANFAATATVNGDGTFQIAGYENGDEAPPGDYVATVQWFKIVESEGGRGPNVLPPKYASKDSSPIKITVGSGPTAVPPIEIN